MGELLPYRPPRAKEETTAHVGMIIFLGSWAMLFAALFFSYAFLRSRSPMWPPEGVPALPVLLPGVNTLVLILSSASLHWGLHAVRRGRMASLRLGLIGALVTASLFLGLQVFTWLTLHAQGLTPEASGPYGAVFWGLTLFHAAHVLVGVLGLSKVTFNAFRGQYLAAKHLPVKLWTLYWHFVGIVWALMFVSIFML